ncbi:hypothetical protein MMB232_00680 [Brevundimonas subvibrioides]|uniref:hypothetical protein n=1 Tax=Brevundimonas subvibrioides TaxID=74313 RepID=UPI0032D594A7
MRSTAIIMGLALLSPLCAPLAASAQSTPADVRDLVGARGSSGEAELIRRGYVNTGGQTGDDRVWTNWWNAQRGVCLSVVTMNGRYNSIITAPAPDCRGRPTTLPGPIGGPVPDGRPTTLPGPTAGPVNDVRTETIRFARGATSAVRQGTITGYQSVTYLVDLRAGQMLDVDMRTSNRSSYFNITAPRADTALFVGSSSSGNGYRGRTTVSGTYRIDVYIMRNAARRGESARYTLTVAAPPR